MPSSSSSMTRSPNALRIYVAGVVVTLLDFCCHLCNHYPLPCWWTKNRVYWWAYNLLNPFPADAIPAHECGRTPRVYTGNTPLRCNMPRGHRGNYHAHNGPGVTQGWLE